MDMVVPEKPKLLQAIELILASPEDIKREALQVISQIRSASPNKLERDVRLAATKKIISNGGTGSGSVI